MSNMILSEAAKRLHRAIEVEANTIKYGQVTFTVIIRGGDPDMGSININRSRRRKYKNGIRI